MTVIAVAITSFIFGAAFGYITCGIFSYNASNEEWEELVRELHEERKRAGCWGPYDGQDRESCPEGMEERREDSEGSI